MALSSQVLYEEFEGTLTPVNDPSNAGSQASVYGYLAGGGTTLREKWELFIKIQENGSGRPITVNRRSQQGPGKVVEPIFAQEMQERLDFNEFLNGLQQPTTSIEYAQLIWFREVFNTANPDANWAFTDEIESQLLAVFDGANWPVTRAALIEMLQRAGSRSEEMDGAQVILDEVRAAEDWRAQNKPGSPTLNS